MKTKIQMTLTSLKTHARGDYPQIIKINGSDKYSVKVADSVHINCWLIMCMSVIGIKVGSNDYLDCCLSSETILLLDHTTSDSF